jgi:hypothetical protein
MDSKEVDPIIYKKILGKLIHRTITRWDLSYFVVVVSQCMNRPLTSHLVVVMLEL